MSGADVACGWTYGRRKLAENTIANSTTRKLAIRIKRSFKKSFRPAVTENIQTGDRQGNIMNSGK